MKPESQTVKLKQRAQTMGWPEMQALWGDISGDAVSEWNPGKAFEYLIVRGFELSGLRVEYPFEVRSNRQAIEQIDGMAYLDNTPFLIECKDKNGVDIEAIAKLHSQLLRRPPTTLGCVLSSSSFTKPALLLAGYMIPYRILLWTSFDIGRAITSQNFREVFQHKYEWICKNGLIDDSLSYQALEVSDD